jgi:DNA-binding MarR family transcriptional regulator
VKDAIQQLQQLGFGQYESQAYVALLQYSPLNGYELAKASGIPRPNIYSTLQKLEERGAVVRLESQDGVRYAPVASDELIQRLRSNFQDSLASAELALNDISNHIDHEHIWNARGYHALLDHGRALVEAAQKQLTVAVFPKEAAALADCIKGAEKRSVEITTLCLSGCPKECGNCRGRVYRYHVAPEQFTRWLVLIPDDEEVLAGEIGPGEDAMAVRTRQRMLISLASWYIRQSILLSAIMDDIGDRLNDWLSPETRECLNSITPGKRNVDWMEPIRRLFHQQDDISVPD